MAIHWQVKFKSLRAETDYTVNVYDGSYYGNPVVLKGAAEPFVTDEDDDNDFFKPVRTQSGYLRIVDDGYAADGVTAFDWRVMIPTDSVSRPVTLTDGNGRTLWRGYLQPQSYGGRWKEYAQEREFPLVCQLSVLSSFDISPSAADVPNFGWCLYYVFSQCGTWGSFHFPDVYCITEWLFKCLSWSGLTETDDMGVSRGSYTCLELLEEICKFWGFTCRVCGEDVFFMTADYQGRLASVDLQDLDGIGRGTTPQYAIDQYIEDSQSCLMFGSTDNGLTIESGLKKAVVSAKVNPIGHLLNVNFSGIQKQLEAENAQINQLRVDDTYYFTKNGLLDGYEDTDYSIALNWDQSDIRSRLYLYDEYTGDISGKHNFNWAGFLSVNGITSQSYTGSNAYGVRFRINNRVNIDHSIIYIKANVSTDFDGGYLVCRLRVGDEYWNGTNWVNNRLATFNVPYTNGKIDDNRQLMSSYPSYEGYGIPTIAVSGEMVLDICNVYNTGATDLGDQVVRLTSFEIGLARFYNYGRSDRSENTYTRTFGSPFSETKQVDTIFATDNDNQPGYGLIMNADGSYCTEVMYEGQQQRPEEGLAARIAYHGRTTKRVYDLTLRIPDASMLTPMYILSADNASISPVSISHDWRDDVLRVKAIEI